MTVLADLPAYPDNMSPVGDGTTGSRCPARASPIAETPAAAPVPAPDRRGLLPTRLQPQPLPYGLVALVDGDGTVLPGAARPGRARIVMATGVRQHGDTLWLGSLTGPGDRPRIPRVTATGGHRAGPARVPID